MYLTRSSQFRSSDMSLQRFQWCMVQYSRFFAKWKQYTRINKLGCPQGRQAWPHCKMNFWKLHIAPLPGTGRVALHFELKSDNTALRPIQHHYNTHFCLCLMQRVQESRETDALPATRCPTLSCCLKNIAKQTPRVRITPERSTANKSQQWCVRLSFRLSVHVGAGERWLYLLLWVRSAH